MLDEEIKEIVRGKTILITGGTGSFGNTILKRIIHFNPREIRILSRDEYKHHIMEQELKGIPNIKFLVGDVRDKRTVDRAMMGVDIVYHAAAMKHVPECEKHVVEAVMTNVIGAQNVIDSAINENVERVICISTDKAVEPINAMGMTKALQEKIFSAANLARGKSNTIISGVRYGNVIGSRGSVIPLFRKQILCGVPITLTDPSMTRFLLSLKEGIDLVFEATIRARGGEIFVKKMPSVRMDDLAKAMAIGLNKPDHPIKTIGTRMGEKKHEVLVSKSEIPRSVEEQDKFIIIPPIKLPGINGSYPFVGKTNWEEYTSSNTTILDLNQAIEIIKKEGWFEEVLHPDIIL